METGLRPPHVVELLLRKKKKGKNRRVKGIVEEWLAFTAELEYGAYPTDE